jgi:hypothetical protein
MFLAHSIPNREMVHFRPYPMPIDENHAWPLLDFA